MKNPHPCCPACKSDKVTNYQTFKARHAALHFIVGNKNYSDEKLQRLAKKISELWGADTCDLERCRHCGFLFSNPFIAGDKEFYDLAFDFGYPEDRWEFYKTLDSVQKEKDFRDLKYLEIGAGKGAFIEKLLATGVPKENITATEYSEEGMNAIKKMVVRCINEDIRKYSKENGVNDKFDVICFFQVLEHLDKIDDFFNTIEKLLNPGGHIFFAVPNPRRVIFLNKYDGLLDMPPNHIGEYTVNSIKYAIASYKWKIIRHGTQRELPVGLWYGIKGSQRKQKRVDDKLGIVPKTSLLKTLGFWTRIIFDRKLGNSQWFHIQKLS